MPRKKALKRSKSNLKQKADKRRADWIMNDEMIETAFAELAIQNKKIPSYEAIAKHLNLDVSTVKRHVAKMDFAERFGRYRIGTDKVVENLFRQATTGRNHHFMQIWLELFEGLGEKKKLDITTGGDKLIIERKIIT